MMMDLETQLRCATRELAHRRTVYPRLKWKAPQDKAQEIAAMEAIVATLEGLMVAQDPPLTLLEEQDDQ